MAYSDMDITLLRQVETHRTGRGAIALLSLNSVLLEHSALVKVEESERAQLEHLKIALERREKVYNRKRDWFDTWRTHWYMHGSPPTDIVAEVDRLKAEVDGLKQRINAIRNSPIVW